MGTLINKNQLGSGIYTIDNLVAGTGISIQDTNIYNSIEITDLNNGYIGIPWQNPTTGLELVLHMKRASTYMLNTGIFGQNNGGLSACQIYQTNNNIKLWVNSENPGAIADWSIGPKYSLSEEFWIKINWNGTSYTTYYKTNLSSDTWTQYATKSSSIAPSSTSNKLYLGSYGYRGDTSSNLLDGKIYLYDCYLKIDGQYVFNGKTATANDYTIIGTPTITGNNAVLSGVKSINNTIDTSNFVSSTDCRNIVKITQSDYDTLQQSGTLSTTTLYVIYTPSN